MRQLDYIAHHGILGMKWGIRRSPAQLGHRTPKPRKLENGKTGDYKNDGETVKETYGKGKTRMIQSRNGEHPKNPKQNKQSSPEETKSNRAKYVKIGAAVGAGALAAYGAYKVHQIGTDEIARRGGDLVGKILGAKDRMVDKANSASSEFQQSMKVAKQKAKLRDVLPERENTVKQALEKYKSHPEIAASVSDWMTRDNTVSLRFGSKGNSLRDLEEYLVRAWPQIVKAS